MTRSWRFLPWNFKLVSEAIKRYGPNAIPKTSTAIDWPFGYDELEPYYDKHEYSSAYPDSPAMSRGRSNREATSSKGRAGARTRIRRCAAARLNGDDGQRPRRTMGYHPYPGPPGIRTRAYRGLFRPVPTAGSASSTGCFTNAKVANRRRLHPAGREDQEPHGRDAWPKSSASRWTRRDA